MKSATQAILAIYGNVMSQKALMYEGASMIRTW